MRITKQFLYGVFYLLILALIGWGFYGAFIKPAPTCFDNIRNQNEEGVDCGGVCGLSCTARAAKDLEVVGGVTTLHPATSTLVLIGKIQNPNTDLAVSSFDYRFDLYGSDDALLRSVTGSSFIYAGEIKYLVAFTDDKDFGNASRVELVLDRAEWQTSANFARPRLTVLDSATTVASTTIAVKGKVTNSDDVTFPKVTILALFRGAFGDPVGASVTELDDVAAGEMRAFSILHPLITAIKEPKAEIYVYGARP